MMSVAAKMLLKIILKASQQGWRKKIMLENNFQWLKVTNFLAIRRRFRISSIISAIKLFQPNIPNRRHISGTGDNSSHILYL